MIDLTYNLIVKAEGWKNNQDSILASRAFLYTDPPLMRRYAPEGARDFNAVCSLPTIFVEETSERQPDPIARVGWLTNVKEDGRLLHLNYSYDDDVPKVTNSLLGRIASELNIQESEFRTTHWAIKGVYVFRVLFEHAELPL